MKSLFLLIAMGLSMSVSASDESPSLYSKLRKGLNLKFTQDFLIYPQKHLNYMQDGKTNIKFKDLEKNKPVCQLYYTDPSNSHDRQINSGDELHLNGVNMIIDENSVNHGLITIHLFHTWNYSVKLICAATVEKKYPHRAVLRGRISMEQFKQATGNGIEIVKAKPIDASKNEIKECFYLTGYDVEKGFSFRTFGNPIVNAKPANDEIEIVLNDMVEKNTESPNISPYWVGMDVVLNKDKEVEQVIVPSLKCH